MVYEPEDRLSRRMAHKNVPVNCGFTCNWLRRSYLKRHQICKILRFCTELKVISSLTTYYWKHN